MSLPTSRGSYADCYQIYDRALTDENGVRIRMKDYDFAFNFRMRMHQARKINRQDNCLVYDEDHPMYNASAYDCITVRIKQINEQYYLYLERNDVVLGEIEPLSELEEIEVQADEEAPIVREPDTPVALVVETFKRRF